jgi:hypothetical protein
MLSLLWFTVMNIMVIIQKAVFQSKKWTFRKFCLVRLINLLLILCTKQDISIYVSQFMHFSSIEYWVSYDQYRYKFQCHQPRSKIKCDKFRYCKWQFASLIWYQQHVPAWCWQLSDVLFVCLMPSNILQTNLDLLMSSSRWQPAAAAVCGWRERINKLANCLCSVMRYLMLSGYRFLHRAMTQWNSAWAANTNDSAVVDSIVLRQYWAKNSLLVVDLRHKREVGLLLYLLCGWHAIWCTNICSAL